MVAAAMTFNHDIIHNPGSFDLPVTRLLLSANGPRVRQCSFIFALSRRIGLCVINLHCLTLGFGLGLGVSFLACPLFKIDIV